MYQILKQNGRVGVAPTSEVFEVAQTGESYTVISDTSKVHSFEEAALEAGIDLQIYEIDVKRSSLKHYQQANKDKDESQRVVNMTSMEVHFKLREVGDWHPILDSKIQEIKKYAPKYRKPKYPKVKSRSKLFVPCIFDLHMDKLAHEDETGGNYDIKISTKIFNEALDHLISKVEADKVGHILFPIGNDFFQYDSKDSKTTAGTFVDSDGRWRKSFKHGCKLMVQAIETLAEIAPVSVYVVPGNHDTQRAFYMGEYIDAWFANHLSVDVVNTGRSRKYFRWGKNLIGLDHGDKAKDKDLALLMAEERPLDWAETLYRVWLLGHLHTSKSMVMTTGDAQKRTQIYRIPSLCGSDEWHHVNGYKSLRQAQAMVMDKELGLESINMFNLK